MENLGQQLFNTLIKENRWVIFVDGLLITLMIAAIAVVLGVLIGSFVAIAKYNAMQNKKLRVINILCDIYLTVIRGTPVVVQLLIMNYIIFAVAPIEFAPLVACITFGINSGAYVAEIVRAGLASIDKGQIEAGRSLGLSKRMTMRQIILPQAIKNVLPALGNEFIVLFKETSVVGYIAVTDLTRAAEMVRSRTYDAFVPLLLVAGVYLAIVMLITYLLKKMERKLSLSDGR